MVDEATKAHAFDQWTQDQWQAFQKAIDHSPAKDKALFKELQSENFFAGKYWLKDNTASEAFNKTMARAEAIAKTDPGVKSILNDLGTDLSVAQYNYRKATNTLCGH